MLNNDGKVLFLDSSRDLHLYNFKDLRFISKDVTDFRWADSDVFVYCVNSVLHYQFGTYLIPDLLPKSKVAVKLQSNICEIISVSPSIEFRMENGENKTSSILRPHMIEFFKLLKNSKLHEASRLAVLSKKDFLYACLCQAAIEQKDFDVVLLCCTYLQLNAQTYCLLKFQKSFGLSLLKGSLETSLVLNEFEQYQRELEAFNFSSMFAFSRKSPQHESLFAYYRRQYLKQIGREEFIDEYKSLEIKTPIEEFVK
eukprot:NODE_39_length_35218_cov_0.479655.p17 type:complete len:255 gc:universal NODE_39_length_35218_cov_0.479655:8707-9471(+)